MGMRAAQVLWGGRVSVVLPRANQQRGEAASGCIDLLDRLKMSLLACAGGERLQLSNEAVQENGL